MEGGGDQSALITVKMEGVVKTEVGSNFCPVDDDLELDDVGDRLCVVAKVDLEPEVELNGVQDDLCSMEDPLALEEPPKITDGLVTLAEPQMESGNNDNCDKNANIVRKCAKSKATSKLKKIRPAICRYCNTGFPSPDLYEHHMSTEHQDERPYSCRHCRKTFQDSANCRRHETIHNPKRWLTEPAFKCDLCSKAYHLKTSMENHRKKVHFGYKPPKRNFKAPVLEHHSTKGTKNPNPYRKPKEIFPCPHCDLKFEMRCELRKHLTCHTKERPFPCPICQQPFALETQVKSHIRDVHEKPTPTGMLHPRPKWQAKQPCPCTVCGKVFSVPSQLRNHMTLHTGELPHGCTTCGKRFRMVGTLKHHIIWHHTPELRSNPLKLYKCLICGKDDIVVFNILRTHRKTHAHIPYNSEKEKPFACGVCRKPHFLREGAIICAALGHDPSSLHKAMFKFKCPECPPETFGFRNLFLLRKHWEQEHPHRFLPTELRKGMYNVNLKEDELPTARVDKKTKEKWKNEGIPEDILKSESQLYIELPLLPIPEEERLLKKSRKWKGKTVQKELKCDLCGIQVASTGNLSRHRKVVHNPNRAHLVKKGYQCSQCNKMFWKVGTLKAHEKSHQEGYQPRRVGRPRKSTVDIDEVVIKQEVQEVEEIPLRSKFRCRFCARTFALLKAVRMHELRQHVRPWSTSSNKNHIKVEEDTKNFHRVNDHDAKAVAKILSYKTVQVSLIKWNFPQGMVDKCREEYGVGC